MWLALLIFFNVGMWKWNEPIDKCYIVTIESQFQIKQNIYRCENILKLLFWHKQDHQWLHTFCIFLEYMGYQMHNPIHSVRKNNICFVAHFCKSVWSAQKHLITHKLWTLPPAFCAGAHAPHTRGCQTVSSSSPPHTVPGWCFSNPPPPYLLTFSLSPPLPSSPCTSRDAN